MQSYWGWGWKGTSKWGCQDRPLLEVTIELSLEGVWILRGPREEGGMKDPRCYRVSHQFGRKVVNK